ARRDDDISNNVTALGSRRPVFRMSGDYRLPPPRPAPSPLSESHRKEKYMSLRRFRHAVIMLLALTAVASATASAAKAPSYSPSLSVRWPATSTANSPSGTFYTIAGCGYNSSYGGVTVVVTSPYAVSSAGQMPDSNGCISLSNFDTLGPGHYEIDAYQTIKNKSTLVASTSFGL